MGAPAQAQPTLRGGYIGVALSDLGARAELMRSEGATCEPEGYTSSLADPLTPPEAMVERIGDLVTRMGVSSLLGMGVAVWDQVSGGSGQVTDTRFGSKWAGFPFAERLAARVGAPVALTSGVNAAARAEATVGAAAARSPLLYIHLGRTVASALVVNGVPLVGAHERAGQLLHWRTGHAGPRCACGAEGHLGPLVSAQSLVRLAIGLATHDDETMEAVHRVTHGRAESLTAWRHTEMQSACRISPATATSTANSTTTFS